MFYDIKPENMAITLVSQREYIACLIILLDIITHIIIFSKN